MINQGENKSYICEHDLFVFMQELEGVAPTSLNSRPKQESKDIEESILNVDLTKRFKQEGGSLFTQAFIEDSILIFRHLKKLEKEKEKKNKFRIKPMSNNTTADSPQAAYSGQVSSSQQLDQKRVNNATFKTNSPLALKPVP